MFTDIVVYIDLYKWLISNATEERRKEGLLSHNMTTGSRLDKIFLRHQFQGHTAIEALPLNIFIFDNLRFIHTSFQIVQLETCHKKISKCI